MSHGFRESPSTNHDSSVGGLSEPVGQVSPTRRRGRMTRTRERRFVCPETARRDAGDRARATIGRGGAKTDIRRWRVSARARGAREGARRRARARRRADDRTSRARRWSVASSSDARGRRRGDGGSDRRARRARATRARATRDARRATNDERRSNRGEGARVDFSR